MAHKKAKELLEKYKTDDLSEAEKALVEKWLLNYQEAGDDLSEEKMESISANLWEQLQIHQPKKTVLWKRLAVASCLLACLGTALFFYVNTKDKGTVHIAGVKEKPIVPGGNKAILTLANGSQISLNDAGDGILAKQSGIRISKTKDGQLVYQISENITPASDAAIEYNSIETPKGGQYQIDLPDGTKVWLNAVSRLTFPLSFSKSNERRVELKGEAYFEVAKDLQKPFIVQNDKQAVEVLGTHFNVNAYTDEPIIKTTLLEGSVKVRNHGTANGKGWILTPGQQAQLNSIGSLAVVKVDPQVEVAWKNGQFSFENEPIENIMRQISRWYDVEIVYKDNVAGKTVWGSITRYSSVSKVLSVVERTGKIHFKVEGRRVIVTK